MNRFFIDINSELRLRIEFNYNMSTFFISKQIYKQRDTFSGKIDPKWIHHSTLENISINDIDHLRAALDKIEKIILLK